MRNRRIPGSAAEEVPGELGELIGGLVPGLPSTQYRRGQVVMAEGATADRVLVIRSGEFGLRKTNLDGREITVAHRRRGQLVGELAVVAGTVQATTVVAMSDASAAQLPATTFRQLLATRHELALTLVQSLAGRLTDTSDQLLELATDDGMSRLCRQLVRLAESQRSAPDDRTELIVRIGSQQALAESLGLQRSGLVSNLRELRRRGWIDTRRGVIRIHSLEELREQAGGARDRADRSISRSLCAATSRPAAVVGARSA